MNPSISSNEQPAPRMLQRSPLHVDDAIPRLRLRTSTGRSGGRSGETRMSISHRSCSHIPSWSLVQKVTLGLSRSCAFAPQIPAPTPFLLPPHQQQPFESPQQDDAHQFWPNADCQGCADVPLSEFCEKARHRWRRFLNAKICVTASISSYKKKGKTAK